MSGDRLLRDELEGLQVRARDLEGGSPDERLAELERSTAAALAVARSRRQQLEVERAKLLADLSGLTALHGDALRQSREQVDHLAPSRRTSDSDQLLPEASADPFRDAPRAGASAAQILGVGVGALLSWGAFALTSSASEAAQSVAGLLVASIAAGIMFRRAGRGTW